MGAKILVVDDSPTIRSTVEWLLTHRGYTVHVEQTGLAALAALRKFLPDLIVLDVRLEHFDGVDLCGMIRRIPKFSACPIVMLSGLTSEEDKARAFAAGANAYVGKPVHDVEFLSTIEAQLKPSA
ncbi:MAG: response regulator [Chloroflexi bacterium]|nr:response regulator [Chloroflexota bacterium]